MGTIDFVIFLAGKLCQYMHIGEKHDSVTSESENGDLGIFFPLLIRGSVRTTDIDQSSQHLRHLDPGMGLNLGVFGFPRHQNNSGSSGGYVP